MEFKYKCKWCGTGTNQTGCFSCREKYKIITESKLFESKTKNEETEKQPYRTRWERTYTNKAGSETKKLIDFVNKSGTIHYGREKLKERMGV